MDYPHPQTSQIDQLGGGDLSINFIIVESISIESISIESISIVMPTIVGIAAAGAVS